MPSFDAVTDEYDVGRPEYPSALYGELGPIKGALVIEGGAGTGIATRALIERGARVIPFDLGARLLGRAVKHTGELQAVMADGAHLPFRDGCADLLCFAQSWHWIDERFRASEAARVIRPGGRWAAWWSQARADGEEWFDSCWTAIESVCTGTRRSRRDGDWGADLGRSGLFLVEERVSIAWMRQCSIDQWLSDQRSHSYMLSLSRAAREELVDRLGAILRTYFPHEHLEVPYETALWIAHPT